MTMTPAAIARQQHLERVRKLVSVKQCSDCGLPIFFAKTYHGKTIPIDPDTLERFDGKDFIVDQRGEVSVTPAVPKHSCRELQVYRRVVDLLRDHPELETVWEQFRAGPMGQDYDPVKHETAKKAWVDALRERGVQLVFSDSTIGYGADKDVSDPETFSDGSPRRKPSPLLADPYASDGA